MQSLAVITESEEAVREAPVAAPEELPGIPRTACAGSKSKPDMRVKVIADWRELEGYLPDWADLAENALEPNVFYESWMLLPALSAWGTRRDTLFVLIFANPGPGEYSHSTLCGLFPLERKSRYRGLPVKTLTSFWFRHCFLGTPLVRRYHANETMSAFLDWVAAESGVSLVEFHRAGAWDAFGEMLEQQIAECRLAVFREEQYSRALFRVAPGEDRYNPPKVSAKGRREFRRRQQRLAEHGVLEYRELGPDDDLDLWLDQFLKLEASGWKGQQGTALKCSDEDRRFFLEVCHQAFRRGRLFLTAITLNGSPLAMQCNYMAHDGCFAFKTCFDERYEHYSPGSLMLFESVSHLSAKRGLYWMDSCSSPASAIANRLCSERKEIQSTIISAGDLAGKAIVWALPGLREIKKKLTGRKLQVVTGGNGK